MHPLNTFSTLLDYQRIAPFIIRFIVGIFIIYLGRERYKKGSFLSYIYFVCGIFLVGGYYTQLSSIVGVILLKFDFYVDYWKDRRSRAVPRLYYFLYSIAGTVLISLIFSGAGLWALDMPF